MKIAWLAPFPVQSLEPQLKLNRRPATFHACSWIINLSTALARIPGVELHLLTESQFVPKSQSVQKDGIHYHVVKSGIPGTNRGFPPWLPLEPLLGFKLNSARLNAVLNQIKPDVVHGHGTEAAYARAAIDSGRPHLISIQGIIAEYQKTNPSSWYQRVEPCERWQVQHATHFTCRTSFDSGFVLGLNPRARIFNIHEAMSPLFFENQWQPEDPPQLLFVGSVCERKGVHVLLDAFAAVAAKHGPVSLCIVGGGPADYTARLKQQASELGIASMVTFTGQKTAGEIAALHRRSRIYILPTFNDNSPNTLAEAMLSGMPVIASRVGGIPSMVTDGETGLLFECGNKASLATAIDRLLEDPALSQRLVNQARTVARQRHHPDAVAQETLAAYRTILQNSGT